MRTVKVKGVATVLGVTLLMLVYTNRWKYVRLTEKPAPPVFLQQILVPNGRNIFFMETSCTLRRYPPGGLRLTSRQLCGIFSTAKMNPSRTVILYHSCPLHPKFYERSSESVRYLFNLSNFYVITNSFEDLLRGSIVENLLHDLRRTSRFPIEHSADILRLLLLYNYGGAYMDLDFISIKSLDSLPKNLLAPESDTSFSNGFLQFDVTGKGNAFLRMALKEMAQTYRGWSWAANGPELIERTFYKYCNNNRKGTPLFSVQTDTCGISLSEPHRFYPVFFNEWPYLFVAVNTYILRRINPFNNTIAVHFWNHITKAEKVNIGEHSTYEYLAREYCNEIIMSAGDTF